MHDFWTKLGALLLPGMVLAVLVGGLIAISISVTRGADRLPGEWLDDNREYGEAIDLVLVRDTSGPRDDFYLPGTTDDELVLVIPTKASHGTIDIEKILSRCLEFLRDGDVDQNMRYNTMTLEYRPRTLKSDAMDAIEAAQNELARIEKETQLRRDIERALAALRGEK